MSFDTFAIVDWSGGKDTGAAPRADAIWSALVRQGRASAPVYHRNRQVCARWLTDLIETETAAGRRLFLGFDFPFGYPKGFAKAVTGSADPLTLWDWLEDRIEDGADGNNRFDVAADINAIFRGLGPFWGNALKRDIDGLARKGKDRSFAGLPEKRAVEVEAPGTFTVWQLAGQGAVGSQVLMGLPVLARLRRQFGSKVSVWPFEKAQAPVVLAEVWPSLLSDVVAERLAQGGIKDAHQVEVLARALARIEPQALADIMAVEAPEEGWILGVGHVPTLTEAARMLRPPRLKNDCFALPPGVDWTPVDVALERLRSGLSPVVGTEFLPVARAAGRVLARDHAAQRSNPPAANSAVDGYGFSHASITDGPQVLPLAQGRAAAGAPFAGVVLPGHAIRVLTGALLPQGVDTVVLEEDTDHNDQSVAFEGGVRAGANTRKAGEDVLAGTPALKCARVLRAQDLALAAALGIAELEVYTPLRVGVLSTGDEVVPAGTPAADAQTYDANRPMLLSMAQRWGYTAVDLGHVSDQRAALRKRLDRASQEVDVILTTGGASAGDEDHMSALLAEEGAVQTWRIAIKPGRPLALGLWRGVPVFGLPGNPVAAFVCALIFARPALGVLSGAGWSVPRGFTVPAAFSKRKKPGRREYLRARIDGDGHAEVFQSEGSGRISGLTWADGLVEIGDEARDIEPGDPVTYYPFGNFGL